MPRIVVLMSVYNEAQYLDETIPALLSQAMPDFQAVVLDNGSTDGSWEILQRFTDPRLTLIRSPENLRPGRVANLLVDLAFATWPRCGWFLNAGADDVMEPEYLEAVLDAAAAHPDVNCIFSPWRFIDGVNPDKRFPAFDPETAHAVHQIPAWHAFTRDLRERVGPQDEQMIAADWDWIMRAIVARELRPHQLDRPYISLRVREGERKSQSEEVSWPALHRHLCEIAGKPVPQWAQ